MIKTLKRLFILTLVSALSLSMLAACDDSAEKETETQTETESESESESGTEEVLVDFDYASADLSKYITLSESEYLNTTVTLGTEYIVTDEQVEQYIADERFDNKAQTNGDTKVTDQPIKLGDSAFIYYTGYLDGTAFEGGSNASSETPHELSIGSGSFIPGFEEGLIGIIPADTSKDAPYDLHVTFPEDYSNDPDLAGKAVVFKVWIEYVVQYTIPELTDDYVRNTLEFDGTVAEYKSYVQTTLQTESDGAAQTEVLDAITSTLMEKAVVLEYPQESLDFWYEAYIDQFEYDMQMFSLYYGMSFDTFDQFAVWYLGLDEGDDWQTTTLEYVKETVKSILIYHTVADQQGLAVTDEEFLAYAKELAEYYSSNGTTTYTYEEIIEQIGEQSIRQNILMEKVDEFFLENCTIEYKDQ